MHKSIQGRKRAGSARGIRFLPAILTLGAVGCADERGLIVPRDAEFRPPSVAASIFSLRYAGDNVAVVQVHLIADALGLTAPAANVARARGARDGEPRLGSRAHRFDKQALEKLERARASRAPGAASGSRVPLFPVNFLGRTFAYDALTGSYFADDGLGAGPQNGVRFLLYTLDGNTFLPAEPLFVIGFVDLIDVSNATSTRLRVRAFDTTGPNDRLLADYLVDGAFAVSTIGVAVNLVSNGLVADENGRFDFAMDELLESDDALGETIVSVVHDVVSDEGSNIRLSVEGIIANDGSFADLRFVMDVRGTAGRTVVDLRVVDGLQDGTIEHNGRLETLVGGTVSQPTFDRARGGSYTLAELEALDEILFGIDDILFFASELFAPLADLFGVA